MVSASTHGGLAQHTSLPTGHFNGERAAIDILVLALSLIHISEPTRPY